MVLMFHYGRKWCHFCFSGIYGPKANNLGKCMILFVTVLFIGEEQLSLFTLLNTYLSKQFCFEILLKVGENTF